MNARPPPYGISGQKNCKGAKKRDRNSRVWWRRPTDCDFVMGLAGDVAAKVNSKKAKGAKNCEGQSLRRPVRARVHEVSFRRSFLTSRRLGDGDRIGGECSKKLKGAKKRETDSCCLVATCL